MKVYPIVVVNDPNCAETTYTLGVYSSMENVIAQLINWTSGRSCLRHIGYDKEEWGTRYWFYDSSYNQNFYADIEELELDDQVIVL